MDITIAMKILEVDDPLTSDRVRKAYISKVKIYHPDKYQLFTEKVFASRKFIEIKNAYDFINSYCIKDDLPLSTASSEFTTTATNKTRFKFDTSENNDYSFFNRILNKLPSDSTLFGQLVELFLIFPGVILLYFMFVSYMLRMVAEKIGLLNDKVINTKDQFICLCINTIAAIAYLPIITWMYLLLLRNLPEFALNLCRIILSAGVIIFIACEWLSFAVLVFTRKNIGSAIESFDNAKL